MLTFEEDNFIKSTRENCKSELNNETLKSPTVQRMRDKFTYKREKIGRKGKV